MARLMDVNGLTVRFYTPEGTVYAVNDVTYTLDEGESLAIVGESGSGKSVHALAIMGLIPSPPGKVTSGTVMFDQRDLLALREDEIRLLRGSEIAMIFQDPMTSLNPVLKISTQLTEAIKLHLGMTESQARNRAVELLEMVGIPAARERLDDYPHQFSGGMRQRVMIAMSLSCNPRLLIADEPTTALDVTIQAQIVELIKRLRAELGMALIWITHDLGVAAGIADHINVMYAGQIVERGPIMQVFKDPRSAYTLGLLNSLPRLDLQDQRLVQIEGQPPDMREEPHYDPFAPRNPYATERCWQEIPPLEAVSHGHSEHYARAWYDLLSLRNEKEK